MFLGTQFNTETSPHYILVFYTYTHINKQTYANTIVTDLVGADLSVDVSLLSDAVLQVRDVGLEPVPVADDGSSLHRVATLRPLPSAGQKECERSF